jgi:transposase
MATSPLKLSASEHAHRTVVQRAFAAGEGTNSQVDFLNLEHWRTLKVEDDGKGGCEVQATLTTSLTSCPYCGTASPEFKRNGTKLQVVRDVPHAGKPIVIRFRRQRYLCLRCGKTAQQPLAGVTRGRKLTQRLIEQTEKEAFHVQSTFTAVAKRLGVSDRTVRNVFTERGILLEGTVRFETPCRVGVDGVYIGRKQRCIVTDLTNGRIIEILPECSFESLVKFFTLLPDRGNVELVAMDMCPYLAAAVRRMLPQAEIVVDTFHVQRMANKELNQILRRSRVRVPLTRERRLVSSMRPKEVVRTRFLLDRRRGQLSKEEVGELLKWRLEMPVLNTAYKLKEGFLNVWLAEDRQQADKRYDAWVRRVEKTLPSAFRKLRATIKKWRAEIFNYFDHDRESNACTEARNNSVKTLQRIGRGYRFPVVRTKLLYSDTVTGRLSVRRRRQSRARRAARPVNRNSNVERLRGAYDGRILSAFKEPPVNTDWLRRFDHVCELRLVRRGDDPARSARSRKNASDALHPLFAKCRVG